jgi:hypothetical protein
LYTVIGVRFGAAALMRGRSDVSAAAPSAVVVTRAIHARRVNGRSVIFVVSSLLR